MTPLEKVKAALKEKEVPPHFYQIDEEGKKIKLNNSFLYMVGKSSTGWQALEDALDAFRAEGGTVFPEYSECW
jgi:hypothetical protein